jgi:ABC-type multidrug transport system fused ATPase/permease subunit
LPQEPHLLTGTVRDNIRFQRSWIDDDEIERAARLAHIYEEIGSWPEGFDRFVGPRADAVSGGQRQRLCLARALAGQPDVLMLDEPTSALDHRSERLIQNTLEELHGRLTLIVVAHRITTLSMCDRVMVIRDGQVEGFDPAGALYTSNVFFRQAVDVGESGRRS